MEKLTFCGWKYSQYFDFVERNDKNTIAADSVIKTHCKKRILNPPVWNTYCDWQHNNVKLQEIQLTKGESSLAMEVSFSLTVTQQPKLDFNHGQMQLQRTNDACGWICGEWNVAPWVNLRLSGRSMRKYRLQATQDPQMKKTIIIICNLPGFCFTYQRLPWYSHRGMRSLNLCSLATSFLGCNWKVK